MATEDQRVRDGVLPGLVGTIDERQRFIARWLPFTVPATAAVVIVALLLELPPPPVLAGPADRYAYLARWLLVALLPYCAVFLTILARRAAEGAHNPLLGVESESLKVHCRVMQNTLEQYLLLAVELFVLAAHLPERSLHLVAIAASAFVVARLAYWKGYLVPGNCLARAPGVQMTATLTIGLLPVAALAALGVVFDWALPWPGR